jgi:translation initiation factor IF-2
LAKFRVYEVAEELGIESSHLIQMLREMDVPVRSHMSTVDPGQVARLHARLERERRADQLDAPSRPASTRRRRRRRREPQRIEEAVATEDFDDTEELEAVGAAGDLTAPDVADEYEEYEKLEVETAPAVGGELEAELEEEELAEAEADLEFEDVEAETAAEPEQAVELPGEGLEEEAVLEAEAEIEEVDEVALEEDEVAAVDEAEVASEEAEEPVAAAESAPEAAPERRKKRKPKPVRRDMPSAPTASAAPGGTVRIQAEGYTVDGRRKSPRERSKRRRVDQQAVKDSVKKTLASIDGGQTRKRRRDSAPTQQEVERERRELEKQAEKTTVRVNEFLTVAELADLIDVSAQQIITFAFKNLGLMVTINQRLDFDQIELICEEAGYEAILEQGYEADLSDAIPDDSDEENLTPRAPVVTVMGHVDHGKTSLLDYIREANVIAGESGGITQHIGAYSVNVGAGKRITFLDTPGHRAFTAMRARGADITDLVILVVAADDAVMPQTIEAISHAKNAGVPLVVAVNKIDLPSANVDKVKQELLGQEVVLEEFGGDVLAAEVSAKTGVGLDDLLEKVLLQAELLELKSDAVREARGTVVEAELDRGMGPVATVLVQSGTLRVGDDFVCGLYGGRVRALLDERGNIVHEAGPATPVRVLGLEGVPQAGDSMIVLGVERVREIVTRRQQLEREKEMRRRAVGTRLEDIFDRIQAGEQARLNVVLKGDTDGSVQALSDSLEQLSTDEVAVEVIHRGVGGITESDVLLATTSQGLIIGFHVRPDVKAQQVAEREAVEIRIYNVIYEAVEDMRLALEGMLAPEEREVTVGTAEVRQLFRVPKVGTVAGCYVSSGTIKRNLPIRLLRDQIQIYEGTLASLKRFKDDVREVRDGYECGMGIEGYNDLKVGDIIESFQVEEIARTLAEQATS